MKSMIEDSHSLEPRSLDYFWVRDVCINYGAIPILRLTQDFEPQCYDGRGNQKAIGFRSGIVLSFDINCRGLQLAFKVSAHQAYDY